MASKRAVLLVFDYAQVPSTWMGPSKLLGMEKDIFRIYNLAVDSGCSPSNITIVTDVKYKNPPWRSLHVRQQPRVVTLPYPVCQSILDVLTQFMAELASHAAEESSILFYYSGHGVSLKLAAGYESHMALMTSNGERRYLSHRAINAVLNPAPTADDRLTIPIIVPGLMGLNLSQLEVAHNRKSLQNHSRLVIVDACQAATLSGLPFIFEDDFIAVPNTESQNLTGVGSIVTTLTQNAPSTIDGSPFTTQITKNLRTKHTLASLHSAIVSSIPTVMKSRCTPVLTSSKADATMPIPFV